MLLSTIFAIVVDTHFVLWNWAVITNIQHWADWIETYPSLDFSHSILAPDGFLEGYRITADGFPVVQALFEPLGVVAACTAIVNILLSRRRDADWAGQNRNTKE